MKTMGLRGLFRGSELGDREKKNLLILDIIRKKGPIGRTDVSKMTGLNIVTVSNYIDHYLDAGIVSEGGYDTSSGGRKPMLVDLNPKSAYVVGVGFDMADMVGVITDLRSNVIFQLRKKRSAETGRVLLDNLIEMIKEILDKSLVDNKDIKGIGLAVAGIIDVENMSVKWPGDLGTPDVIISADFLDVIENSFGIPVVVENDADCAAFGEQWLALDPELKNVIYMYSGVSCGIIINGQIYKGASGCAGELGILNEREIGKYDCRLESRGLGRWNIELGTLDDIEGLREKYGNSEIFKSAGAPDKVTFSSIVEAARLKDEIAIRLLNDAGENLGKKVAFLVNLLNPQVMVIGGGVEKAGHFFFEALKNSVKDWALEEAVRSLKIVPAKLAENAVPLGAASLIVQKYFENF